MNRKQRRQLGIKGKEPTYTLNRDQINAIKQGATKKAVDEAFILMLGIPVMVLHDNYAKLVRIREDGKNREERFMDMILDLYDSYDRDYLTLQDIIDTLHEECGLDIIKGRDY